jgi:sulfur-oxidizing protein SoxA
MRRLALALTLLAGPAWAEAPAPPRSGFADMAPATQAMQADDTQNPAMFFALDGKALFARAEGEAQKSCADCHGADGAGLAGVAARYPAFDARAGAPVDLAGRVEACRREHQRAPVWPRESRESLAMAAYLGLISRGAAMAPPDDARLDPARSRGAALYRQRLGQLALSCAQCHDDHWGRRLGGALIPQGQIGNYPAYRLEWQAVGSLQRRIRNCMTGVRAEPFAHGAAEMIELELHLATRARGLPVETPSVRP